MDIFTNSFAESIESLSLTFISKFIDVIFNPEFLIILGVLISGYFLYKKFWRKGFVFFGSFILVGIIVKVLKEIFMRARPQNSLIEATGYSFPSGHVSVSVVFFGLFIYLYSFGKSLRTKIISYTLFFILIFVVGVSRVYLRVHWLTDILAGFLVGGIVLV